MSFTLILCTTALLAMGAADDLQHGDLQHGGEPEIPAGARKIEHDKSVFRPDPTPDLSFSAEEQQDIYGNKYPVLTQRPLLELGRDLYREGPLQRSYTFLGEKNPVQPQFFVYGDAKIAAGINDNAAGRVGRLAFDLNLDLDFRITSTERVHAFVSPANSKGETTRYDFMGRGRSKGFGNERDEEFETIQRFDALFFEGDMGSIWSGASGKTNSWDLPFSFGLMPLLFQNGVWVEDAFQGVAFTIPARNSSTFNISNMDITFFAGFDDVTTGAVVDGGGDDNDANVFGVAAFIEANEGYWEVGYGYTEVNGDRNGAARVSDLDYHNATISFSRRYGAWLTNSARIIANFGQDTSAGGTHTAEGFLFLLENSFVTRLPSTLIPYANFWFGVNRPQSLARAAGAGGVLKNTGVNFETDGLTAFPKLDDSGHDTVGGAVGVEYLFNLDKQIVFEVAALDDHGGKAKATGQQLAVGVRAQYPFYNRFIVRADAMYGLIEGSTDNLGGFRLEFRYKF